MRGRSAGLSSRMIMASAASEPGGASATNAAAPLSSSSPAGRPPSWLSRLSSPASPRAAGVIRASEPPPPRISPRPATLGRCASTPRRRLPRPPRESPARQCRGRCRRPTSPRRPLFSSLFRWCSSSPWGVSVLLPRRVSVLSYQSPAWGRGSATNCGKKLTNGPQTSCETPFALPAHRADFLPQLPCSLGKACLTEGAGGKGAFR